MDRTIDDQITRIVKKRRENNGKEIENHPKVTETITSKKFPIQKEKRKMRCMYKDNCSYGD